jgi:hypothetical protein
MRRVVALALACTLAVGACGDDEAGPDPTPDDGTATATALCDALRELDNEMVAAVNASVAGIAALAPEERMAGVLTGMDEVRGVLAAWRDQASGLELPPSAHDDDLRAQLVRGADEAIAEIDEQAADFAAAPAVVPDDEVQGVVGTWFNSVEKVMSVLEPEIVRLDDAPFEQAILDEPSCRNVIQQYVVD